MNKNDDYNVSARINISMPARSESEAHDAARMKLHKLFKEPLLSSIELDESSIQVEEIED